MSIRVVIMDKKRLIIIIIFIMFFLAAIIISILYYNNKYSISFETGTSEIILTKYVEKNNKIEEPVEPIKEGYVFKEWQLNGETYDFETEINEDIVLTAKWIKEEYIKIVFDTDSEYKIENRKILKGDIIDELPVPIKENYEFIGWYLNDKLYNNEEIYDNVVLVAHYKNIESNTIYEIGDRVEIIGKYAISAYSTSTQDYYKLAIGWEREILGIIENSEFPYMVGNKTGVTGFFKSTSIKKI